MTPLPASSPSTDKKDALIEPPSYDMMESKEEISWREKKRAELEDKKAKKRQKISDKRQKKEIYAQNTEEIKNLKSRQGKDIYVGEGLAEIKGTVTDVGEARTVAKRRALNDLAQSIKVRIRGTMQDVLKFTPGRGTEERVEQQITTYTENVLSVVQEAVYNDYPRQNCVTVLVYLSKSDYDEKVARDIQIKLNAITRFGSEGIRARNNRAYIEALKNFTDGLTYLDEYFGGLPISSDIDNDGREDDARSFFETSITGIVQGIRLEPSGEKVVYSASGHISRQPFIYAHIEEGEKKLPVANLPLRARFIKGGGVVAGSVRTGINGEARIAIDSVDSSYPDATIQVSADLAQLGMGAYSGLAPACEINLSRMQTIAFSVNFFNSGARTSPQDFMAQAQSVLVTHGYNVEKTNIPAREPRQSDISAAAEKNLDYLLSVTITASGGKVGDFDMYYSNVSSVITAYKLPEGYLVFSSDGPSARGGGTSISGAGYDGYSRIRQELLTLLKEKVKELK